MRSVLALGLLRDLNPSAYTATVHHSHLHDHVIVVPGQGVIGPDLTTPGRFAVPGWSDDATRRWLDNASSSWSQA